MKIINPATEEVITEIAEDHTDSIQQKYLLLKEGQKSWKNTSLDERLHCIQRFSDLLEKNENIIPVRATHV